jgi:hypothetical protein
MIRICFINRTHGGPPQYCDYEISMNMTMAYPTKPGTKENLFSTANTSTSHSLLSGPTHFKINSGTGMLNSRAQAEHGKTLGERGLPNKNWDYQDPI